MNAITRFLMLSALFALALSAQERPTAPLVPSSMLDGQRLVEKTSGFSIEAPPAWQWLLVPAESATFKNYAASNPAGLGYALNVAQSDSSWTLDNARDVQIGMAKKLRNKGFTVEPLTFESTSFPTHNSYHFIWRVTLPDGTTMYRFGYAFKHHNRIISATCFGADESEPSQFAKFVGSIRFF